MNPVCPTTTVYYNINLAPIAKVLKLGIYVGVGVAIYKAVKKKDKEPEPQFSQERTREEKLRLKQEMMRDYERWLDKKLKL